MGAKHLLSSLQLASQVIRPLTRQRGAELGLLPTLHQLPEGGRRFLDARLERGKLPFSGQVGIGERALAVQGFDLQLLSLPEQPTDPDQLLAELRFLRRLTLDRFGRGGQRSGRLGRGGSCSVDPGEKLLPLADDLGAGVGEAFHLVGSRKRGLALAIQRLFGVADSGLDLEHWVRGFSASIGNGGDDLSGGRDCPQIPMLLNDASRL